MTNASQGIIRNERGEDQPADRQRAQAVHQADPTGSPSREATRDPQLSDDSKAPGTGMTPDGSGAAPRG